MMTEEAESMAQKLFEKHNFETVNKHGKPTIAIRETARIIHGVYCRGFEAGEDNKAEAITNLLGL